MVSVILMYHSVSDKPSGDPYSVSKDAFEEQVRYLLSNNFEIVPLKTIASQVNSLWSFLTKKQVALTFDDGYQDFILNVLPVLRKYELPATVFIVTGMLGMTAVWSRESKDVRLMEKDEIKKIRASGIDVGSHTRMHIDLTKLTDIELKAELETTRQELLGYGEVFLSFSYPWGRYSQREITALKEAGYHCGVTTDAGCISLFHDLYRMGRITVRRDMGLPAFAELMEKSTALNHFRRALSGLLS